MVSAVIFDLDGTIIESEEVWGEAFVKVLERVGVKVGEKHPQTSGIAVGASWRILKEKYDIGDFSAEELSSMTFQEYAKNISKITLREGFEEFVGQLKESGVRVGLATSTDWWIVEKIFDLFPIESLFDAVITGEEVMNKKPAPDAFLQTAEKLGVMPEQCVVIEDTPSGEEAAVAAGMKVIMVGRDITDFGELTLERLMLLLPKYGEKE